jgi:hypothetical protein
VGSAARLVQLLKRELHLVLATLACIREPDPNIATLKEGNAKLFLQTHDLAADARLPHSECFGRPPQASVLGCGYEVTDFRKLGQDWYSTLRISSTSAFQP